MSNLATGALLNVVRATIATYLIWQLVLFSMSFKRQSNLANTVVFAPYVFLDVFSSFHRNLSTTWPIEPGLELLKSNSGRTHMVVIVILPVSQ